MIAAGTISLREGVTNQTVTAQLFRDLTLVEIVTADNDWLRFQVSAVQNRLARGVPADQLPEHKHWRWQRKAVAYATKPGFSFHGIVCGGDTQGLMLVHTNALSRLTAPAQAVVYIDYVASAPWNLPALADTPRYKGVGRRLIEAAITHSHAAGFDGCIGLHALPQAEAFYRDTCGMTDCGVDIAEDGLIYFEMTPAQAVAFSSATTA